MAKKTTKSEVVEEEIIETTEEEILVENRAILTDAVAPETTEESVEETVDPEPIPEPEVRHSFSFKHPKRDLVFIPGTGGNFFATMIYHKMQHQYVGNMEYNPKINEYSVSQNMSQLLINGDSRNNVCGAIRSIPLRLERMRDYIVKLQEVRNTNEFDWMVDDMNTILSVAHRLTVNDLHYIAFSDFLISKNNDNFTLQQELEVMGPNNVGEFYDNLHDLFYHHLNAHSFPYMTDICHVPYHVNTFKPKGMPITNYSYGVIVAHEQILYTTTLMKTKHLLRKKSIKDDDVSTIRGFIEKHLNSEFAAYEFINEGIIQEMYTTNAANKNYATLFFYRDMIIEQNEDYWAKFYEFYGFKEYFWLNKSLIMDTVAEYHQKNIELMLNFCTKREIEFMIDPMKRIRGLK